MSSQIKSEDQARQNESTQPDDFGDDEVTVDVYYDRQGPRPYPQPLCDPDQGEDDL